MPENLSREDQRLVVVAAEVSDSIKSVFDLTSRIDERVKRLIEQHVEINQHIEKLMGRHENILSRVSVLENKNGNGMKEDIASLQKDLHSVEIKIAALEIHSGRQESNWKTVSDLAFKVLVAVGTAFIMWKVGMK